MHYLIDTNVLIRAAAETKALPRKILGIINEPSHRIGVSIVSLWEIAIKTSLRKLDIDEGIFDVERHGYELVPMEKRHLKQLMHLPLHHRDPFDRMLIVQAMAEGLAIITSDRQFTQYGAKIILA